MLIPFMVSKIHRATVTSTDINYEGSIAIDEALIEKANLRAFQKVEVYDIANGNRFSTYVIPHGRDSRGIVVNGAAARLVAPGDPVIIVAYALIDEKELNSLSALVLHLNGANEIDRVLNVKL
jgi:aspartate 1-decarboxylase